MVGTEAIGLDGKKALPPVLPLLRALSRTTRAVDPDDGAASTPSIHTPVTVPFLWEDAPGRPKLHNGATSASENIDPADGGDPHQEGDRVKARLLMPLKLPPRLQFPSTVADSSLSPKTVLQGPHGCTGGARRTAALMRDASFRRAPNPAGGGFFYRRKMDKKGSRELDAAAPDASCCSPSLSSSSSSSFTSFFFFGDDCSHETGGPQPEKGECPQASVVRFTRFRRNRSLPSMTTSHLWASIRKSVKQITPWS